METILVSTESVPVEILARGQDAVDAFLAAQDLGTLPIYRGRLCVLGQDRYPRVSILYEAVCICFPLLNKRHFMAFCPARQCIFFSFSSVLR